MGSTDQLVSLLTDLLDKVVDTFAEWQVDLPEKRWITTGTPPADGEALVVSLQNVKPGKGRGVPNSIVGMTTTATVGITITVFRCASAGCSAPEEVQGLDRARDAWVLNVGLVQKAIAGQLVPEGFTDIQWQGVTTQAPFGAIAATVLSFSVQTDPR